MSEVKEELGLKAYEKVSNITGFQAEMIGILHKTVAKNTSISELAYFLSVCKSLDLNPINKEVWCYKDNQDNLLIFAGRDGFLSKAQKHRNYNGLRSCEVCINDEFSIDVANNVITHKFGTGERGTIIGAYAIAFVKDAEPTIEWANITDYDKKRNTWLKFQADMIKKVAECHALKKAFGIPNLVSEYDFEIRNGVAYAGKYEKPEPPKDKSEERVLELIEACKTKDKLNELKKFLKTAEHRDAYDKKYATL